MFLILFTGKTGIRAILSFITTILLMWKVLVPCMLKGWNPIWLSIGIVLLMTIIILGLIYGFDRRCLASVSGAFLGIAVTAVLGVVFTDLFRIHGAVMESSESLLYAGYQHLNLTSIFMSSIFLDSSGAVMDLSVDIYSSVYELVQKKMIFQHGRRFVPDFPSDVLPAVQRQQCFCLPIREVISHYL